MHCKCFMFESKICIFKWPTHMVSWVALLSFSVELFQEDLKKKTNFPSWKLKGLYFPNLKITSEISCESWIQQFNEAWGLEICRSRCLCLNGSMTILHNLMCCFFNEWLQTPRSFENSLVAPGHVHFETSTISPPNKNKQLRLRSDSESSSSSLASRKQKNKIPKILSSFYPNAPNTLLEGV